MTKHATASFHRDNENFRMCYIQKYYLLQELRSSRYPADIQGIQCCFSEDFQLEEGDLPDKLSDCVVTYTDIGMEKHFDEDTVRHVLMAYVAYHNDSRSELTDEEERAAANLNHWLIDWEKQLLAKLITLSEDMERQVRSGDSWLTDYEIIVTVYFYVREDDSFYDDMTHLPYFRKKEIDYGQLLYETSLLCHPISAAKAAKEDYRGIGDSRDHNDFSSLYEEHKRPERHCLTFHELYDHVTFPRKHLGRIGRIWTDINVQHQSGFTIDLKAEQAVAVRDEPRIREEFVFYENLA